MLVNSEGMRIGDLPGCYGIYTLIINSRTLTDVVVDVSSISKQTYPKYSSGHGFCRKVVSTSLVVKEHLRPSHVDGMLKFLTEVEPALAWAGVIWLEEINTSSRRSKDVLRGHSIPDRNSM